MPELIPVLDKNDIDKKISLIADQIKSDYINHELVLVGILKGAFVFLSDLIRFIDMPLTIDFLRIASYGSETASSGNIHLTKEIEIDIQYKDVLIIEDIVDTGRSLDFIVEYLKNFNPDTVKICTLIDKRERRETAITVDYSCFKFEKGFFVGYGLDYAEKYRNLPGIYTLNFNK